MLITKISIRGFAAAASATAVDLREVDSATVAAPETAVDWVEVPATAAV